MNAVNRLKRDHTLFRSKLNVIESALHMGRNAWFVLRAECFSLARQLEGHTRREGELSASYHAVPDRGRPPTPLTDHRVERRHLAFINRFLIEQPSHLLERIQPTITLFISGFRRRMNRQELTGFPMVEETLVLSQVNQLLLQGERPLWDLGETMTVAEVVTRYPAAGVVLERLFIDQRFERHDCLDEVAWRHGMESRELLAHLEEGLARGGTPEVQTAQGVSSDAHS
jgi:hypothetical protein